MFSYRAVPRARRYAASPVRRPPLGRGRRGGVARPPRAGGHRGAIRPRARGRAQRRAGSFRHPGCGAGRHRRGHHGHVLGQPQRAGHRIPASTAGTGTPSSPPAEDRGTSPTTRRGQLLGHDRYVQSWSGAYAYDLRIDGQVIPVLGERPGAAVQPPLLSGQRLTAPGPGRAGCDHAGANCTSTSATPSRCGPRPGRPPPSRSWGSDTMPTIGAGGGPHLEMGTGRAPLLHPHPGPRPATPSTTPRPGPQEIFVNFRPGVNTSAAMASLNRSQPAVATHFNFGVFTGPVLRPAEIINYRSMGTTPAVLGSALAAGRGRRTRTHPGGLGPASTPRPGLAQDPRVDAAATGVGRRLAVERGRAHRHDRRRPPRHRARTGPVDRVRQRDPRRALAERAGARRSSSSHWAPSCWPMWWPRSPGASRPARPRPCSCEPSDACSPACAAGSRRSVTPMISMRRPRRSCSPPSWTWVRVSHRRALHATAKASRTSSGLAPAMRGPGMELDVGKAPTKRPEPLGPTCEGLLVVRHRAAVEGGEACLGMDLDEVALTLGGHEAIDLGHLGQDAEGLTGQALARQRPAASARRPHRWPPPAALATGAGNTELRPARSWPERRRRTAAVPCREGR